MTEVHMIIRKEEIVKAFAFCYFLYIFLTVVTTCPCQDINTKKINLRKNAY